MIHAETLGDFVGQATELFGKGYEDAAAVVIGSSLEAHLRLLCGKYGIDVHKPSGKPVTADTMNAELVKATAYNSVEQKAVISWQAIRNAAAHGEYDKYSTEQVGTMIDAVREFILRHPA